MNDIPPLQYSGTADGGLRLRLAKAIEEASGAKEETQRAALRLVVTAINEWDTCAVEKGDLEGISDIEIAKNLKDMIYQREKNIEVCESKGHLDMAEQERQEISILTKLLPPKLNEQDTAEAVTEVIVDLGAKRLKDMGRVMTELKSRYDDKMDYTIAKKCICKNLS